MARLDKGNSSIIKILITGGAGFIGSHLIERLVGLGQGDEVIVYDNFSSGRKERPYIQLQFVRTAENAHEAKAFLRQWRGKGADAVHIKPMLNFAGSCGPPPARPAKRPCLFLWTSLAVNWDGTVPLCCLEIEGRTDMGNAVTHPLKDIFTGSAFAAVRELHARGRYREHPVCRNCDVPSVAWPLVLGAVLVGDLSRRKIINTLGRFFPF